MDNTNFLKKETVPGTAGPPDLWGGDKGTAQEPVHRKIPYQRCVCDGTVPSKAPDRAGLMDQTPKEQPVPGKVL